MEKNVMSDSRGAHLPPDLGVPAARNARIYALVGLAITAIVGLLIWDVLGLILGLPLAIFGLVRGALGLGRSRSYPRDRRAAMTAIVAGLASLALVIPIVIGADKSGEEPVDCRDNQACPENQRSGE